MKPLLDAPRAARRFFSVPLLLRGLAILLLVGGCDNGAGPATGSTSAQPVSATAAEVQGAAKHSDSAFSVELTGPTSVAVGERASFVVTLRAGTGYKVNAEYPHKFKTQERSGITSTQKVIDKTMATITSDVATFPFEVVLTAPGQHTVAGQLAFSVCTAERCLIERRDVAVNTTAK